MQKQLYRNRRDLLRAALLESGFEIEYSDGGLYLWATQGRDGRETVAELADKGILVAPGDFYGPQGKNFVRVGLTATDERIEAAARRLTGTAD